MNHDKFSYSMGIIIYVAVSEFLPVFAALDYTFMLTYIRNSKHRKDSTTSDDEEKNIYSLKKSSIINTPESSRKVSLLNPELTKKSVSDLMIKFSDLSVLEQIYSRKYGLGSIHKAIYLKNDIICRVIKYDRLSRYDLEGLQKDMEEIVYYILLIM
jgi:Mg2+/Co2+ transporter CorB